METAPIVVFGATGYTGRLICAELDRRGTRFVAAGRDRQKLEQLNARLSRAVELEVASVDDAASLRRMAARGRVVLDCVGPFQRWGRAVQDAALETGRHFLDITGEAPYMLATAERDREAKARGVTLINAVGFDVVPTDAAAVLASEACEHGWGSERSERGTHPRAARGAPVAKLRIAFTNLGSRPSQGTTRSMLDHMREGGMAYLDGAYRREPVGADRWEVPFPAPVGTRLCVSIPWGDLATAPRSTGARTVRTYMSMPPSQARALPILNALGPLTGIGAVKSLLERGIARMPEGPSDAERARSSFAVYVEAEGQHGTRAAWVTGPNGYTFTAASAAVCAERAADPAFTATGALTPAQAFGARSLLEALAPSGVRFEVVARS